MTGLGVALVEEQFLPLPHHTEKVVVQDNDLDRQAVLNEGSQLLQVHLETAVAADGNHLPAGKGRLRPHGCRQPVPHGPEPAGSEQRARLGKLEKLGCPHLVLPDVGGNNGI